MRPAAPEAAAPAREVVVAPARKVPTLLLSAVGDIRLDGPVGAAFRTRGAEAPTRAVRSALAADVALGNLECSITRRGTAADKKWTFRAPPENAAVLKAAGFTVLTLANNHVMDYGPDGLEDTLAAVDRLGILRVGAGLDAAAARRPVVVEKNGVRVGILGLTSTIPDYMWAGKAKPGTAYSDIARLPAWIAELRKSCHAVVVAFHGGTELAEEPNEVQRAFGRAAVDAGADAVIGHHPHVVQALEVYKGKPILHSVGNFLFVSPTPSTRWAVIARLRISASGVESIDFVPVDTHQGGIVLPAPPEGVEAVRALLDREGALTADPGRFRVVAVE